MGSLETERHPGGKRERPLEVQDLGYYDLVSGPIYGLDFCRLGCWFGSWAPSVFPLSIAPCTPRWPNRLSEPSERLLSLMDANVGRPPSIHSPVPKRIAGMVCTIRFVGLVFRRGCPSVIINRPREGATLRALSVVPEFMRTQKPTLSLITAHQPPE